MVSWSTVQSLVIFFGPVLLPRLIGYYRSIRSRPASQIRPLSQKTSYALTVLFASGLIALLSTLPLFHPSNIFRQTNSKLQTSGGVLLTRLAALRPITPADERLRQILDDGGLDARLHYTHFGPYVLTNCPFARPGDIQAAQDYLFFASPQLLGPHLLHLIALGIATSSLLSGPEGSRWRTMATLAGIVLAVADAWFVATYDYGPNTRSTRLAEVDFVYWKLLVWRGLAIAAVDGLLGFAIWLQATGRAFVAPASVSERLMQHSRVLELALGKMRGVGILRNGVVRDAALRGQVDGYWVKEGEVMKDVFEEPEVLQAQRNALKRLDLTRISWDADTYVDAILGSIQVTRSEAPE